LPRYLWNPNEFAATGGSIMAFTLTRDAWKKFKTDNDLSKSSIFSRADVGPTIDKFWEAANAFSTAKTTDTVRKLFTKCTDLEKAFDKFIALKEIKNELKAPAKAKIEAWKKELEQTKTALATIADKYKDDLAENQKAVMIAILEKQGIVS
jgi:hypothetical protein